MEDYKKKYKDALERAKKELQHCGSQDCDAARQIFRLFPELESKDEKIRTFIKGLLLPHIYDIDVVGDEIKPNKDIDIYRRALAWLEKQGKPEDMGEVSDGYHTFNELYYYRMLYNAAFFNRLPKDWVHKSKRHHDGEECFGGGWFIVMANLPTGQISNHYELKDWDLFQIPEKDIADEWDGHTPQQAAERLHKYLLEKQGEAIKENGSPYPTKPAVFSKQNPADKVEPKFQNGQWIVWQDKCYKVNYNGCGYELIDQNGLKTSLEYGTVDKSAHLWSIADAKDGDILVSNHNQDYFPFIYNGKYEGESVGAYCGMTLSGEFIESQTICSWTINRGSIKPATKKQCEQLFERIKKEGYEWNATTKELSKKILIKKSDKDSKLSEEDEDVIYALETILDILIDPEACIGLDEVQGVKNETMKSWLKDLKQRLS